MEGTASPRGRGVFRRSRQKTRPDYKQRLTQPPAPAPTDATTEASFLPAEQVRLLADRAESARTAFQSVAVVALQALNQASYHERRAAETTISLAQGQKLKRLVDELEATSAALGQTLSPQGTAMLNRRPSSPAEEAPESSWWFALSEALHALGQGTQTMQSLAAAQPHHSATRTLSDIVARLLEHHYHTLFAEAEHWLG